LKRFGQSMTNAQTSAPQKPTKQKTENQKKQIVSGHAVFWLKRARVHQLRTLAKRMHAGLVIERQEIAISRQKIPLPATDWPRRVSAAQVAFGANSDIAGRACSLSRSGSGSPTSSALARIPKRLASNHKT
jgi:hypothetical protein